DAPAKKSIPRFALDDFFAFCVLLSDAFTTATRLSGFVTVLSFERTRELSVCLPSFAAGSFASVFGLMAPDGMAVIGTFLSTAFFSLPGTFLSLAGAFVSA